MQCAFVSLNGGSVLNVFKLEGDIRLDRILRVSCSTSMAEHGSEETVLFPTQKTEVCLIKLRRELFVTATSRLTLQNPAPCSALRQRTKFPVCAVIG